MIIFKRKGGKTLKTSVAEAEKRTNRVSIDSKVFELASRRRSFVLEPDYADNSKEVVTCITTSLNPRMSEYSIFSLTDTAHQNQ